MRDNDETSFLEIKSLFQDEHVTYKNWRISLICFPKTNSLKHIISDSEYAAQT